MGETPHVGRWIRDNNNQSNTNTRYTTTFHPQLKKNLAIEHTAKSPPLNTAYPNIHPIVARCKSTT